MVTRAQRRRRSSRRVRLRRTIAAVVAVALIAGGVSLFAVLRGSTGLPVAETPPTPSPTSTPTPTPTPTPLTAAQKLLSTTTDPRACAVSFAGEGIALDPQLQTQDLRFDKLPIPRAEGRVFAGWYASTADAAALTLAARVNGADLVACTGREKTLYAAWTTPEANAARRRGWLF